MQSPIHEIAVPAPAAAKLRLADQLYTQADLERILKVPRERLLALMAEGKMPGPAVLVPGGGHKGRRWTASQIAEIFARWAA